MVKVGTHDGAFHCDEVLGCFMIRQTERFKDASITRTRDPALLATMDAVLDVGGVYDPDNCRFDHHQRGFDHNFGHGFVTKLSSAGLVYKHFGREVVARTLGYSLDDARVEPVYLAVYKNFMEALDAIDNGINQYDTDKPPRYHSSTHLSARVGFLNPHWNEGEPGSYPDADKKFEKAMELAGGEFLECVRYHGSVWLPAREIVEEALSSRKQVDESGQVIVLKTSCPWKEHLYMLEEEMGVESNIKYCLYQDDKGGWRVQAVPVTNGGFESRKALPVAWRGLRDDALSAESGIEGGVFVHMSGFIGGNKTYEGAVAMAKKALVL
eukprot:jgi/Mesvir1/14851/Mv05469-RA.1